MPESARSVRDTFGPMLPPTDDLLPQAQARVLAALWACWCAEGRATVRVVAASLGLNDSTVWFHLVRLRALGLVGWVDGERGTLHPTFKVVTL